MRALAVPAPRAAYPASRRRRAHWRSHPQRHVTSRARQRRTPAPAGTPPAYACDTASGPTRRQRGAPWTRVRQRRPCAHTAEDKRHDPPSSSDAPCEIAGATHARERPAERGEDRGHDRGRRHGVPASRAVTCAATVVAPVTDARAVRRSPAPSATRIRQRDDPTRTRPPRGLRRRRRPRATRSRRARRAAARHPR